MTAKRFTVDKFIEDYKSHIIDNEGKIETLSEFVEYLNTLTEENKLHKERISLLSSLLDLADAIIDTSDNEKAKQVWDNKNEQTEKEWERILNE